MTANIGRKELALRVWGNLICLYEHQYKCNLGTVVLECPDGEVVEVRRTLKTLPATDQERNGTNETY